MSRFSQLETGGSRPDKSKQSEEESARPKRFEPDGRQEESNPPATGRGAGIAEIKKREKTPPPNDEVTPPIVAPPEEDAPKVLAQAEEAYYGGDWDLALRLYSRALQLDASLIRPWVGQVYALLRKRQDGEALTWVNRALDRFPDDPSLLSVRGVVFAHKGMHQRAIGASDYAISQGNTREAWLARGEILLSAGNKNAEGCFQKALEFDPDGPRTLAHIGMAYLDHHKYSGAYEYFSKAAPKMEKNGWVWLQFGKCAERLRFYDQARQAFERALQIAPDNRAIRTAHERLMKSGPISRLFRRLLRE